MKLINLLALSCIAALAVSGCVRTTADRAQKERRFTDRPASISCFDYGQPIFSGRTVGKPQRSDTGEGSWSFVDASNGKLTTVEANCMVVYD